MKPRKAALAADDGYLHFTALEEGRLNVLPVTSSMPFNINNIYLDLGKKEH